MDGIAKGVCRGLCGSVIVQRRSIPIAALGEGDDKCVVESLLEVCAQDWHSS